MMSDINRALCAFFNSLGYPAYLRDRVPDSALLPYVTFDAINGDAFTESTLVVFDWHQKKFNADEERADCMDAIARAIPTQGRRIALENGLLFVYRGTDFQTYYNDPDDTAVIGGRTSIICRFLTT